MPCAGFRAGFHLRLFDDLFPVLHANAIFGTLAFIRRVTHAETAQAGGFGLARRGGPLERQSRGNDDSQKRSHGRVLRTASESDVSPHPASNGGNPLASGGEQSATILRQRSANKANFCCEKPELSGGRYRGRRNDSLTPWSIPTSGNGISSHPRRARKRCSRLRRFPPCKCQGWCVFSA